MFLFQPFLDLTYVNNKEIEYAEIITYKNLKKDNHDQSNIAIK